MINSVTITNHLGESLTIETRFPEKSGFLIRDITGLDPSKADINMTEIATLNGAIANSSRVQSRNIVFELTFLESPTIEETRHKSYKYFPIGRTIDIHIETDTRTCETTGYVESNQVNIFSKEEGASISVLCESSYFTSEETNLTIFSATESIFSFPFSNESLSADLLEFGEISMNTEKSVYYTGDAPIGVVIYLHAVGAVTNPRIINQRTRESMTIDTAMLETITGSGIIDGDDIVISTIQGQKSITLYRSGLPTNILNCLGLRPDWFQLERGDNIFLYTAISGVANIQFKVENQVAYEGV